MPHICIGAFSTLGEAMDALKPWILCMHKQQQQEQQQQEQQQQEQQQSAPLPNLAPFGYCPPSVTFPPSWLQFARECLCIARLHCSAACCTRAMQCLFMPHQARALPSGAPPSRAPNA